MKQGKQILGEDILDLNRSQRKTYPKVVTLYRKASHVKSEICPAVEKSLKDQLRTRGRTHRTGSELKMKMISPKDGHHKS